MDALSNQCGLCVVIETVEVNGCIIKSMWTICSYRDSTVRMIYEIYLYVFRINKIASLPSKRTAYSFLGQCLFNILHTCLTKARMCPHVTLDLLNKGSNVPTLNVGLTLVHVINFCWMSTMPQMTYMGVGRN